MDNLLQFTQLLPQEAQVVADESPFAVRRGSLEFRALMVDLLAKEINTFRDLVQDGCLNDIIRPCVLRRFSLAHYHRWRVACLAAGSGKTSAHEENHRAADDELLE